MKAAFMLLLAFAAVLSLVYGQNGNPPPGPPPPPAQRNIDPQIFRSVAMGGRGGHAGCNGGRRTTNRPANAPPTRVAKILTHHYPGKAWVQAPRLKVKINSTDLRMEAAIVNLDHSIRNTEDKLDLIHVQISEFENFTSDTQLGVLEQISVLKLLQSVSEVKQEYEKIRKEVMEVQELQHQLANSLQTQVQLLQGRSKMLKEKILDRIKTEQS